jgi:hypothetical protein
MLDPLAFLDEIAEEPAAFLLQGPQHSQAG